MRTRHVSWKRRAGVLGLVSLIGVNCGGPSDDPAGDAGDGDGDGDQMSGDGGGDGDDGTGNTSGDGDAGTGNSPGDGDTGTGNAPGDGDGDVGTGGLAGDGDGVGGDPEMGGAGGDPGTSGGGGRLPCASDQDCKDLSLLCDSGSHACAECITPSDCDGLALCENGVCEPLEECENSLDCSGSLVCDQDEGACYACVGDNDCDGGQECFEHACVDSCTIPSQCATPLVCQTDDGVCSECVDNDDCSGSEFCSRGSCIEQFCSPRSTACAGAAIGTCSEAGDSWIIDQCVSDCMEDANGAECVGGVVDDCEFTIDKFDDGDGRICEGFGRSGRWYDWDHTDPVFPTEGAGRTDTYGLTLSFVVFKGVGLILNEVETLEQPYDASAYSGISFYHRESSEIPVETEQALQVDTDGGVYHFTFATSHTWAAVTVRWSDLGIPLEEVPQLRKIAFLISQGKGFDEEQAPDSFWLDDIAFY